MILETPLKGAVGGSPEVAAWLRKLSVFIYITLPLSQKFLVRNITNHTVCIYQTYRLPSNNKLTNSRSTDEFVANLTQAGIILED